MKNCSYYDLNNVIGIDEFFHEKIKVDKKSHTKYPHLLCWV